MTTPEPETPPRQRSAARRFLNRLEVDKAVFFAIAARAWQVLAGPITLLLIVQFFTPEMQGIFYAFSFLLAFSTLSELGLNTIILFAASHEWHALRLAGDGHIHGDPIALARLADLSRLMNRWYAILAVTFAAVMIPLGLWYIGRRDVPSIDWRGAWVAASMITAVNLALSPRLAILEGCHQIAVVNALRLGQALAGNLVVWSVLAAGGGLWTAVASAAVKLLFEGWLVFGMYGRFFQSLRLSTGTATIPWKETIWPLQWRIALNSLLNYVSTWIFTFVAFEQQGLVAAGQTGMTWTVLTALQSATLAWVQTRGPLFGSLVARRDFQELDRVFLRVFKISTLMMALGSVIVIGGVFTMEAIHRDLFQVRAALPHIAVTLADKIFPRILPTLPTALFCLALLGLHTVLCFGSYVRAHQRDPFLPFNLVSSTLTSVLIWFGTLKYGPTGAAAALLAGMAVANVPFNFIIWRRTRNEH
ncbi:hypothetical protein AYO47_07145 [Planctomyces sp. SCGC AG-212-M04]|nr:hypothetical protein AYO47_07145 [Planctomyces sp. SCGC AG-212-M04]